MKKDRLDIIYEDKYLLVVNKPNNLLTINLDKGFKDNLYSRVFDYIHKKNKNAKIFIIHRLDKETSGLVMFAKNKNIKEIMQKNWSDVKRHYITLVHNKTLNEGIIRSKLSENKFLKAYSSFYGKEAITEYKTIKTNGKYSLLNIKILTGRHHQIRVHMAENNTPIVGDKKYGIKDSSRTLFLMANELIFIHPITHREIKLNIEVPKSYFNYVNKNE